MQLLQIFLEPGMAKYFSHHLATGDDGELKIPRMAEGFKEVFLILLEESNPLDVHVYANHWKPLLVRIQSQNRTLRCDKKNLVIPPSKMAILNNHIKNLFYFEVNKAVEWGSIVGHGDKKISEVILILFDSYGISESDIPLATVVKQNYRHRRRAQKSTFLS